MKTKSHNILKLLMVGFAIAICIPLSNAQKSEIGKFITTLHHDQYGRLWVGTEGQGLYRVNYSTPGRLKVKRYSTEHGLGDDYIYGITSDKLGRIWVGHLNHGVSVYNGEEWKNYDVLTGPLGERVFDITTSPKDGSVWMATSAGLARYSLRHKTWKYCTRAHGLPSDQIETITIGNDGTIYAGTQCDGLAISKVEDGNLKWTTIKGPPRPPFIAKGRGLPSNQINDILVSKSGRIYVATSSGLAIGREQGTEWSYVRGKNLRAKLKMLYCPRGSSLESRVKQALADLDKSGIEQELPAEDYITCLDEDIMGRIWIGYRQKGYQVYDPEQGKIVFSRVTQKIASGKKSRKKKRSACLLDLLCLENGKSLLGHFGEGLDIVDWPYVLRPTGIPARIEAAELSTDDYPELPRSASGPTLENLKKLLAHIETLSSRNSIAGKAVYLGEDWTTQGDWMGRYGRQHAVLCAMHSPFNHEFPTAGSGYNVEGDIGPHCNRNEALRH